MSDMRAPRALPPTDADHAQHDALLVAQLAAGDTLGEQDRREAERLVSGCRDCASLAAELRSVSGAVAWEPVPPRRRDFRLDAEQAEKLRGSAVSRFLRRLALPEVRVLRPAAVGVMSLGLLYMVAVNVWPEEGLVQTVERAGEPLPTAVAEVPTEPGVAEIVETVPGADKAAAATAEPAADAAGRVLGTSAPVPPTVLDELNAVEGLKEEADTFADDAARFELQQEETAKKAAKSAPSAVREATDEVGAAEAEEQARSVDTDSDGLERGAAAAPGVKDDERRDEGASGSEALGAIEAPEEADRPEVAVRPEKVAPAVDPIVEAEALADQEAEPADHATEAAEQKEAGEAEAVVPPLLATKMVPPDVDGGVAALDPDTGAGGAVDDGEPAAEVPADAADTPVDAAAVPADDGLQVEPVLITIGAVLAIAGLLLLLLTWLARRSADPLLR